MQSLLENSDSDAVWRQVEPILEEAMSRLNEKERTLLALRFYENHSSAEAAAVLGIGEWATRKRTERALEKLRLFFARRGVDSTATAIGETLCANSIQAAPAALAKTVTAVALAKGAAASTSTLTLIKGALKIMAWSKVKPVIAVGVAVILTAGTTILVAQNQLWTNAVSSTKTKTFNLRYNMIDAAFQFTDIAGVDKTKISAHVAVTVDNEVARPEDVNLTIQSVAKGSVPLQISSGGNILNFPQSEQLRRENPNVIINLRGKKFGLILKPYLPLPETLTFPYRLLSDGVAEDNKMNRFINANTKSSWHMRMAQGVTFSFPKSSTARAKLEIMAAAGKREYTADARGQIYLKLDNAFRMENPEVTVSEKPQSIWPGQE